MLFDTYTLSWRQQRRYIHRVHLWRSSENAQAANGKFTGLTWTQIGESVPTAISPTPSHIEPPQDLIGPQVETDILFTIDTWKFPREILLVAGDILQLVDYVGTGTELRIGKFWMCRGNERPRTYAAHDMEYLFKIMYEITPTSLNLPGALVI